MIAPPTYKPDFSDVKLTDNVKNVNQDNLLKLIEYPEKFKGAT